MCSGGCYAVLIEISGVCPEMIGLDGKLTDALMSRSRPSSDTASCEFPTVPVLSTVPTRMRSWSRWSSDGPSIALQSFLRNFHCTRGPMSLTLVEATFRACAARICRTASEIGSIRSIL